MAMLETMLFSPIKCIAAIHAQRPSRFKVNIHQNLEQSNLVSLQGRRQVHRSGGAWVCAFFSMP